MWSQVTIFWETVGGIWETVLVPQNTFKKTLSVATRTCLANLSWHILITYPNHRSWDLSVRRSCSTFQVLRISQLCGLSWGDTPSTLRENLIPATHTWDSTQNRSKSFNQDFYIYLLMFSFFCCLMNSFVHQRLIGCSSLLFCVVSLKKTIK